MGARCACARGCLISMVVSNPIEFASMMGCYHNEGSEK